jgi:hypothetical protein
MSDVSINDPDATCPGCHSGDFPDFDHYVEAKGLTPDEIGAGFGAWMNASTGWDGDQHRTTYVEGENP